MGDSDDEYGDRRRGRDKFRGERNDYDNRRPVPNHHNHRGGYDRGGHRGHGGERRGGGRDWQDNRKRDYYGSRDREMGRGASPPQKRMRDSNYNDQGWRPPPQDPNQTPIGGNQYKWTNNNTANSGGASQTAGSTGPPGVTENTVPGTPMVMSFKEFVLKQEDDINEVESVRRFKGYKVEFKKTQINDFFVLHKEEEWFKDKYHPEDQVKRTKEIEKGLKNRLKVFTDLLDQGYLDRVSMDMSKQEEMLKLLDRVVIKLEGGTDEEVANLDDGEEGSPMKTSPTKTPTLKSPTAKTLNKQDDEEMAEENKEETKEETQEVKKEDPEGEESKPKDYKYDADGEEVEDDDEPAPPGDDDPPPPGMENDKKEDKDKKIKEEAQPDDDDEDEDVNVNILHRGSLSFLFSQGETEESKEADESLKSEGSDKREDTKKNAYDSSKLKKTLSLFMRGLHPIITRQEVTEVCKRYPGFLRCTFSEPQTDKRHFRRCWVTFEHDVNIKDICWNLTNIKIKDNELNPIVNRDVVNRVRVVCGVTCHPILMQKDVQLAIKLIKMLDKKRRLYEPLEEVEDEKDVNGVPKKEEDEEKEEEKPKIELPKENPVLTSLPDDIQNVIKDMEIKDEEDGTKEMEVVVDEKLRKALDRLLLYLRIVHCLDYYKGTEYVHEDEMPQRCGIIHVRDVKPDIANKNDVYEFYKPNAEKLEEVVRDDDLCDEDEMETFGKKDEETELANFVKANTQELAKDKWLCPLSGKKFRGPEFIKKHIYNKHAPDVDNVKKEVQYFNAYVNDKRRPCFPEPVTKPLSAPVVAAAVAASPITPASGQWAAKPEFATPQPYAPPNNTGYGRINTFPPKPRGGSRRPIIKYKDLDAPDEGDFF